MISASIELGILPVTPDKLYTRSPYTRGRSRAGEGWRLPGNGKKRSSCGTFRKHEGCLNWGDHPNGKVLVKTIHYHCNSLACPICAGNAMSRDSDRITHRIVSWWRDHPRWKGHRIKPIHVTVSPPPEEVTRLKGNYKRLRDLATKTALKAGLYGGVEIPHPFRHKNYGDELPEGVKTEEIDINHGWYESWHFHFIGFGWIEPELIEDGWIVKNLGVRGYTTEDHRIFELSRYQLSHCGVNSKYNSHTWIGELSSRKYKAPPMPKADASRCPECGNFLMPINCEHGDELIDKEGIYWVDPPSWHYVTSKERE